MYIDFTRFMNIRTKVQKLINSKLNNNSCTLNFANGSEWIICNQTNTDTGWFLYDGCELIIGDVTLSTIVNFISKCVYNNDFSY